MASRRSAGRCTGHPRAQSRRNKQSAVRFLEGLLTEMNYAPNVIVTDKLKSYGAAIKELEIQVEHRQSTRASTTGPRTPISRLASASEECGASNLRSRPNGSWHRLVCYVGIFGWGVIASGRSTTARRWPPASRAGAR